MSDKFKSIHPRDIVTVNNRTWLVLSCHWGAIGYDNLIELQALDMKQAERVIVPADLIPHDAIYRLVDHEAARHGVGSTP